MSCSNKHGGGNAEEGERIDNSSFVDLAEPKASTSQPLPHSPRTAAAAAAVATGSIRRSHNVRKTRSNSIRHIGTIVRKKFGRDKYKEGEIIAYDPIHKHYKIRYIDGTEENYDEEDMKRYYKHAQMYSGVKYNAKALGNFRLFEDGLAMMPSSPPLLSPVVKGFGGFDGNVNSLPLDGTLYRIMEYLEPSDFYVLGVLTGSRSWKRFLFEDPQTEYLFARKGRTRLKNLASKGRSHLKNLYYFRKSVEWTASNRKRKGNQQKEQEYQEELCLNRVGVFSPQEEEEIFVNDKIGYFGTCFFRPGVLAVWGDYSGLFMTPRVDRLFSPGETYNTDVSSTPIQPYKKNNGYLFADSYQVMAVLSFKPYIILGFASGTIHCIDSRPIVTESGESIEYPHVSECRYHCQKGEISSLASIEDRHLVSGCMKLSAKTSEILIHWNALKDGNLERISRIKINVGTFAAVGNHAGDGVPNTIWDVSPMTMASSSFPRRCIDSCDTVLSIGARGQNLVHFSLWTTNHENGDDNNAHIVHFRENNPPVFKPSKSNDESVAYSVYKAKRKEENHHFVYLKYVKGFEDTKLIAGTSNGDLLKINVEKGHEGRERASGRVVLYNCCKGGMVEAVELVDTWKTIMITAGGCDGRIRFWDWYSFSFLGSLQIHPGSIRAGTVAFSPVVSTFFCHERSSLVSFCRDGHLHEWKVHDVAKNKERAAKKTKLYPGFAFRKILNHTWHDGTLLMKARYCDQAGRIYEIDIPFLKLRHDEADPCAKYIREYIVEARRGHCPLNVWARAILKKKEESQPTIEQEDL